MAAIAQAAKSQSWRSKFDARIAAVVSSKPDASGLALANALGIITECLDHSAFTSREAFDTALMLKIDTYEPVLVVLAGFMRILTPAFVAHYAGRLVNIHPSLLPEFTGLNTHQRAIDAGCRFAGATVHLVTDELDIGPILAQAKVPIFSGDTAAMLAERVQMQEHQIYPQAIAKLLETL